MRIVHFSSIPGTVRPASYRPKFGSADPNDLSTQSQVLLKNMAIPYRFNIFSNKGQHLNVTATDVAKASKKAQTIALGDLHGSFHKLVETLVATRLISMPHTDTHRFVQLTQELDKSLQTDLTQPANQSRAKALIKDIQSIIPAMQWTGGNRQLILIGDVLADRSAIDTISLDIIEHLRKGHPERIVNIASNHDHSSFNYLVTGQPSLGPGQQASLFRAMYLTDDKAGLRDKYTRFLQQSQLMQYHPKSQTLYVHAPVTASTMKRLIQAMHQANVLPATTQYDTMTAKDLPDFADRANRFYRDYVTNALKNNQLDPAMEALFFDGRDGFVWVRDDLSNPAKLPFRHQGVKMLVHGHDSTSQQSSRSILNGTHTYTFANLDQKVRKAIGLAGTDASSLFLEA